MADVDLAGITNHHLPAVADANTAGGGVAAICLALRPLMRTLCYKWCERSRRKSYLKEEEEARRQIRVAEIEATSQAEVTRIRETGKMLRSLAKLEPEQTERLHGYLERVRSPPDQLQPPAAS